jgi:uncharacterized phage-associated protein
MQIGQMKTVSEINKLRATVLFILNECGGRLDFISLVKKMYFAQQSYLVHYGRPIFADSFYAKRLGPVPSFTYKALIVGIPNGDEAIRRFVQAFHVEQCEGIKYVSALEKADTDELAVTEQKTIREVLRQTDSHSPQQLSDASHQDKAWKVADKRAKDDPNDNYISLVSIARAGRAKKQILDYIREGQRLNAYIKA